MAGRLHAHLGVLRGKGIPVEHLLEFVDAREGVGDLEGVAVQYLAILVHKTDFVGPLGDIDADVVHNLTPPFSDDLAAGGYSSGLHGHPALLDMRDTVPIQLTRIHPVKLEASL